MTTYKGINGFAVQSVASDPSPTDEGQVWYNNATYAFKLATATTVGTWASGGNLGTARGENVGGAGIQTASLAFGGYTTVAVANTESYNGTSWSPVSSMNTARYALGGSGTQTSALAFGGSTPAIFSNATEKWNGSAWTSVNSMNTARTTRGAGVQTATLAFGGYQGTAQQVATESYNGTSWTSVNSLNTARSVLGAAGTQPAALAFGGYIGPPRSAATESWNGTSWTSVNSLNTARNDIGGCGIQTSALAFGGQGVPGFLTATELWDGTSWTTSPGVMPSATIQMASSGTQASALSAGGASPSPGYIANTYEWTGPGVATTKTITTS
jgi:hypothetical protein